jgi:hypothetical protein
MLFLASLLLNPNFKKMSKACLRCTPYLIYLAVRRCERIGQRWSASSELVRIAVMVEPDAHPTLIDLVRSNATLLNLSEADLENVVLILEVSPTVIATLAHDVHVQPVLAERLITVQVRT